MKTVDCPVSQCGAPMPYSNAVCARCIRLNMAGHFGIKPEWTQARDARLIKAGHTITRHRFAMRETVGR